MNAGQKADAAAVLERARRRAIARAEAAEQRLREAEEARAILAAFVLRAYGYFQWGRGSWIHKRDEGTVLTAAEALERVFPALKRARTTTTEGERDG
jgi:hypothetical protein